MRGGEPVDSGRLLLDALARIDRACLEFEAAWQRGETPGLEGFLLSASGIERTALLKELLLLELDYRRRRGESPSAQDYCARLPGDAATVLAAFELAAHDDPSAAMAADSAPSSLDPSATALLGTSIGPYRLLEVLGQGGMGIVYLAEQTEPLRRRVALKLMRLGLGSRELLARFEAERQTLALMSHPGIACVHDAGLGPGGRPYFVMEHVAGLPITRYCDEHVLAVRERLELLCQVCDAVEHAHGRGVIHRDLKPSNILVAAHGGRAQAKVIDFGLARGVKARLDGKTLQTRPDQILGTPQYMSPEQAGAVAAPVDARTDVYSLGAVLYELLTGSIPFDWEAVRQGDYLKFLRLLREVEVVPPSVRASQSQEAAQPAELLRGDLDWITLRALEKEPARRYGSPRELADDIERHLRGEAVRAGPPSALRRARSVLRRRGRLLGVAVALLIAASAIAGVYLQTLWQESERRRVEETLAETSARSLAGKAWILLGEPSLGQGLALVEVDGDGSTQPAVAGPPGDQRPGHANRLPAQYMYFRVTDLAVKAAHSVRITCNAFDDPAFAAAKRWVRLHYTQEQISGPTDLENVYTKTIETMVLRGTGAWMEHTWTIDAASFRGLMNWEADFRLAMGGEGPAVTVGSVTVAPLTAAASSPGIKAPIAAAPRSPEAIRSLLAAHALMGTRGAPPPPPLEALERAFAAEETLAAIEARLAAEPTLDSGQRDAALAAARALGEPTTLLLLGWSRAISPESGAAPETLERALRLAEAASRTGSETAEQIAWVSSLKRRLGRLEVAAATVDQGLQRFGSEPADRSLLAAELRRIVMAPDAAAPSRSGGAATAARIHLGDLHTAMGMFLIAGETDDGETEPVVAGPPSDRRAGRRNSRPSAHSLYFRVTDLALKGAKRLWIRARLWDDPAFAQRSPVVDLHYTNAASTGQKDLRNTFALAKGSRTLTGTGRWVEHTWSLEDAGFRTFQQGFADFRLSHVPGTPIVVESVEVTSSPPAEGQGNAQRAPAAPMLPGEARIDLGDPGGAIGVRLVDSGDGTTVPGAAGPPDDIRRGRANAPVGLYFYFRVTEPLLKQSACVGLRATFFDDPALAGKNANVTLSYTNARSSGPADLPNTFSMAEGAVRFAGTGRWIQHVWVVEDAGFRTFMQGFADFRLAVGSKLPVVVQSVELAAGHPPVDGPKDAELLRRMTPRVLTLLRTHLARASVVEALGAETSLTEIERAAAIRVAGALSEPAALDLNARSWKLARSAGGTAADYAEALRLAELALARESSNQRYITNTLGVAQYRAGRCEEALATLRRSARSNASHPEPYPPAFDLVGLALCHEKLEQGPEALFLLRIAKLSAGDAPGGDLADFLKEAERDIPLRPEWTPMVEALVAGLQQGETLEAIEALPADALDAAGRELPRRMLRALAETGAEKLVFLRR